MNESSGAKKKSKNKIIKFILKLLIAALVLYFVYRKIKLEAFKNALFNIQPLYIALAFLAFNFSKWISIFRIRNFLKPIGIHIQHGYNWKLFYIGAFYNLFLPSSIGGDAYKIYLLKKKYQQPVKPLFSVMFLDRISGLAALVFLTALMLIFTQPFFNYQTLIGISFATLLFPVYYIFLSLFFKKFVSQFLSTSVFSILSQLFQLVSAWFILIGLGIENEIWNYLVLFMVASLAIVIPVTPGGLGAREFISVVGFTYLGLEKELAVIMSTLFFLVTAVSSFIGLIFQLKGIEKNSIHKH